MPCQQLIPICFTSQGFAPGVPANSPTPVASLAQQMRLFLAERKCDRELLRGFRFRSVPPFSDATSRMAGSGTKSEFCYGANPL